MILGTPLGSQYTATVQQGCAAAFQGSVADVRAFEQSLALVIDAVATATTVVRQVAEDRLATLARIDSELQAHADGEPAQNVMHLSPQLCQVATEGDNLAAQFSLSSQAVDRAHRNFLDVADALITASKEAQVPAPTPASALGKSHVVLAVGAIMVAVGSILWLSGGKAKWR